MLSQPMKPGSRALLMMAISTALIVVFLRPLLHLMELARHSEQYSHILAIPFVTAALLWWQRRAISQRAASSPRGAAGLGALALLGIAIAAHSSTLQQPELALATSIALLVTLWLAAFLWIYGAAAFRAALFPLLFLYFLVPVPAPILDPVIGFLQRGSAAATSAMFSLTGVPFLREGMVFHLPGQSIEIAKECSGIRSSMALLLTTLLAGYLSLNSQAHRTLLVALVVPLAIIKNGIRITTLTLLAVRVDPGFLYGRLHEEGGVVFFLIALALIGAVLSALQRREQRSPKLRAVTASS